MAALAGDAVVNFSTKISQDDRLLDHDLVDLQKALLRSGLPYFERLVSRKPGDPALRADHARAYYYLGRITSDTGSRDEAIRHYRQAVAPRPIGENPSERTEVPRPAVDAAMRAWPGRGGVLGH